MAPYPDPEEVDLRTLTSFGLDDGDIKVLEEAGVNSLNRLLMCNQQFLYGIQGAKIDQIWESALKAFSRKKLDAVICSAGCIKAFRSRAARDATRRPEYLSYAHCFASFFPLNELQVHMNVHHKVPYETSKLVYNSCLVSDPQTASAYKLVSEFSSHQMGHNKLEVEDYLSGKFLELIKKLDGVEEQMPTKTDFKSLKKHFQTVETSMVSQSKLEEHRTFISRGVNLMDHTKKTSQIQGAMATKSDINAFEHFLKQKFPTLGSVEGSVTGTVSQALSSSFKDILMEIVSADLKALVAYSKSTAEHLDTIQKLTDQLYEERETELKSVCEQRESELSEVLQKNNLLKLKIKENSSNKNVLEAVRELMGCSDLKLLQAHVEQLQKKLTGMLDETKPQAELEALRKELDESVSRTEKLSDKLVVAKRGEFLALEIASAAETELKEVKATLEDLRLDVLKVNEVHIQNNKSMDKALAKLKDFGLNRS